MEARTAPRLLSRVEGVNLNGGRKLDIGAFYQVTEAGFDKGLPTTTIADGLEVFRDLSDKDGKATAKLKVGESATVNSLDELPNWPELRFSIVHVLCAMSGGTTTATREVSPRRTPSAGAQFNSVADLLNPATSLLPSVTMINPNTVSEIVESFPTST